LGVGVRGVLRIGGAASSCMNLRVLGQILGELRMSQDPFC
jgi:hypothetical protein